MKMKRFLQTHYMKLGLASCFLPAFLWLYGMVELLVTNKNEFWFGLDILLSVALPASLILFAIMFLIGWIFPRKVSLYYYLLVFAIGIAMYIQAYFLKTDFGLLDGEAINWGMFRSENIISIVTWCTVIIGVIALGVWKEKWLCKIIPFVSYSLAVTLTLTVATVMLSNMDTSDSPKGEQSATLTIKDQFVLSPKENLVVFLLDAMDTAYTDYYLDTKPEATKQLEGFTYFHNTIGMYGYTTVSVPHILSNQGYYNETEYRKYVEQAYAQSPLLRTLQEQNYVINIYTDPTYVHDDNINNAEHAEFKLRSPLSFLKDYSKMSLFRYAPLPLKEQFVMYSGDLNPYKELVSQHEAYIQGDDVLFYNQFSSSGLSLTSEQPTFHFYHLMGAHPPYTIDASAVYHEEGTDKGEQIQGAWKIVIDYLENMKKLGIYDSSNIVIMADHGLDAAMHANPTLMVKPADCNEPFHINEAPISYKDNLAATFVSLLDKDPSPYGQSAFAVNEDEIKTRTTYVALDLNSLHRKYSYELFEFTTNTDFTELVQTGKRFSSNDANEYSGKPYKLGSTLSAKDIASDFLLGWGGASDDIVYSAGNTTGLWLNIGEIPNNNLLVTCEIGTTILIPAKMELYLRDEYLGTAYVDKTQGKMQFIIPKDKIKSQELMLYMRFDIPDDMESLMATDTASFGWKSLLIEETDAITLPNNNQEIIELLPPKLSNATKEENGYVLQPNKGSLGGFWFAMESGNYQLHLEGENVDGLAVSINGKIEGEGAPRELNYSQREPTKVIIDFNVPSVMTNSNVYIANYSDKLIKNVRIYLKKVD